MPEIFYSLPYLSIIRIGKDILIIYICTTSKIIMNKRLQQFLDAENITQSQLADSLGVARAGISHILAGRNKPGFDFIESLATKFPTLSLEWLITGKGRMYKSETQAIADQEPEKRIVKVVIFYDDNTFKEIF